MKKLESEKTIIVGIVNKDQNQDKSNEYLDELEFLTFTAGSVVDKRFIQKIDTPNPSTFIGSGKMNEILSYVRSNDINTIIFDDELSPAQERNISKILNIKVLIFSFEELLYGDCFTINSEIQIPVNDYQKYLLVKDVYGIFYYPEIRLLDLKKSNFFLEFVLFLKNNFRLHIRNYFL